jgi:hypothetical protein
MRPATAVVIVVLLGLILVAGLFQVYYLLTD